jgi:hypothetical protein
MSTTISLRHFTARGTGAVLNYLHIDLAVIGLALVLVLASGAANGIDLFRSIGRVIPTLSASADVSAAAPEREKSRSPLTPAMGGALDQVALRFRVSPEALLPVFEAAQVSGREMSLDPLLIIAVIGIESRFNPFSQSSMGAQGLMQVIPRYHQDKVVKAGGERPLLDPVRNVQIGSQILKEAIRRQGGVMEGLQFYAGATDDAEQAYATKVIAEKTRLEQAPRRRDAGAA